MPNFKQRSNQLELLDGDNIPQKDLFQNLVELEYINTWLGGHKISLSGLKQFELKHAVTIVDIGSGGGDNLRAMAKWTAKKNLQPSLIGVDLKEICTQYAQSQSTNFSEIKFITSDYRTIPAPFDQADIYHCALFCHHLNNEELIILFKWMSSHSKLGFVINDLQRSNIAYYSIKLLTSLFSKSYLVKNDAPLSVWRGFSKSELQKLFSQAGINNVSIRWKWAFRWLIVWKKPK